MALIYAIGGSAVYDPPTRPITSDEAARYAALLRTIDRGERALYLNRHDPNGEARLIRERYFDDGASHGVYCSYDIEGRRHIQAAFGGPVQDEAARELSALLTAERAEAAGPAEFWYPADDRALAALARGFAPGEEPLVVRELILPPERDSPSPTALARGYEFSAYAPALADSVCALLDAALAHTFAPGVRAIFAPERDVHTESWLKASQRGELLLIEHDDEPVGFALLSGAEIELIAVAAAHMRAKLGSALLSASVNAIRAAGEEPPYLFCLESNASALGFYEAWGFDTVGRAARVRL